MMTNFMVAKADSSVVENAISWAISTANDNSHGYSQSSRWGPDYDCSSFVISAFKSAGVNVGAATYTGNMRAQFTQHGFCWIPWSQIGGTSNLQRGDILLNEKTHTEIYLGNSQNVGAHSNRGYPQTGDQTGTEVSVSGYYYHPWNGVLRYVGSSVCNCSTNYAGDYYVSTSSLPLTMRSGHGTNYSAVASIPKGSRVHVSRADGSWAHVEWNGFSGYCSMQYLSKIVSKNYSLHVWVSDTGMGDVPSNFILGRKYYLCYELIDLSTGQRANSTSNINYKATETIRNSSGKIFEHTYENSDYNWISNACNSEDTYTGTVTISGDVTVSSSVSFDVYADTAPQMKIWAWESDDSKEIDTIEVGKTAYCSYLIRDKYTGKNLNDATSRYMSGSGYTVTIKVYNPSGSLIKTQTYKNNDCTWISFLPNQIGKYKITATVTGNLSGGNENTIKAEEKEHKYGSWTITREATCSEEGEKTRVCSICNKKEVQKIAKKGHTYDGGILTSPASCNKEGTKTYTCKVCGANKIEVIPAADHVLVKDKAVNPTCEEAGKTEGMHCSVCNMVVVEQKVISQLGHDLVVDKGVTPTYTQDGLTEGAHCGICGKVIIGQKIIPAITPTIAPENTPTSTPTITPENTPTSMPTIMPENTPASMPASTPIRTSGSSVLTTPKPMDKPTLITPKPKDRLTDTKDSKSGNALKNKDNPLRGIVLSDAASGVSYKVLPKGKRVSLYEVIDKDIKTFNVPATIKINGIEYKVTVIAKNVFRGCKKLKSINIGKNITIIERKAFYGCKNLKYIHIKSKRLRNESVGNGAFKNIHKKAVIKVPKKQKRKYKRWLKKKGVAQTVIIK